MVCVAIAPEEYASCQNIALKIYMINNPKKIMEASQCQQALHLQFKCFLGRDNSTTFSQFPPASSRGMLMFARDYITP
jgi:hypothetical protein